MKKMVGFFKKKSEWSIFFMKTVIKNLEVEIYPTKVDKNDNGEDIVSINKIESNIGIYRFIYNEELKFINNFRQLLIQNGYDDKVIINDKSCNMILKMLREDNPFFEKAESSSMQQAQRDLITSFKRHDNPKIKSGYPQIKTRKKSKKFTFRIMNNNNNVRIEKDKNGYDKIKLAKLGLVKFKTSKKYRGLLRQASNPQDPTIKIKHVTIKRKNNGRYYAVFNVETIHIPVETHGPLMQVGIDIGCGKLAVLSHGQEIPNLDLKREVGKIIHYQKEMSHHKPNSIRYNEARRLFNKWMTKLVNKRNDYYDKGTFFIVKNCCFVAVQNENIIAWKKLPNLSRKLQLNAPRIFLDKLEYKCDWNDVVFVKVPRNFPSTQICSSCGKQNKDMAGIGKIGIRDWDCPFCPAHHDRDVNAAINILNKGLEIVGTTVQ